MKKSNSNELLNLTEKLSDKLKQNNVIDFHENNKYFNIQLLCVENGKLVLKFPDKRNFDKCLTYPCFFDKNKNVFYCTEANKLFKERKYNKLRRKYCYKYVTAGKADAIIFGEDIHNEAVMIKFVDSCIGSEIRNDFIKNYEKTFRKTYSFVFIIDQKHNEIIRNNSELNKYFKNFTASCLNVKFDTLYETDLFVQAIMDLAKSYVTDIRFGYELRLNFLESFSEDLFEEISEKIIDLFSREDFFNEVNSVNKIFYEIDSSDIHNFICGAIILMALNIKNELKVYGKEPSVEDYISLSEWIYGSDLLQCLEEIKLNNKMFEEMSEENNNLDNTNWEE